MAAGQAPGIEPDALFPDSPRVLYGRSPLRNVICQLRYPQILRIEAAPPADFQERIRGDFPFVEKVAIAGLEQLPPELAQAIGVAQAGTTYNFKTEDQLSVLTLTPESLALTSSNYSRWEIFRRLLSGPVSALINIYAPSFFTRIGLRYQNVIMRSEIGLSNRPWAELINPAIAGEIALPNWGRCLRDLKRTTRLTDDRGDGVAFQQGLARLNNMPEEGYLIDFDLYRDSRSEVGEALSRLDEYHRRAGRAFRWCISDRLHGALEPSELVDNES